ncbi:M48 family metalloprotease [Flavobacterium sedimenticola]|uniref:M48 family metalloprotease n=1 Tax=Flavobacterium sedimenticola TaxID=3043286 RepID=A0ABT6XRM3_9FLAO|nr:M48 family metalloprotease [Flavobacterium sedimenticola]MDI9257741.1 M48 family metalloprotease [Flavobacterium sedimenticola]
MTKKKHQIIFLLITLVFWSYNLHSQKYTPIDTTKNDKRDSFLKEFKADNERYIQEIKSKYDAKLAKYISNSYTEFSTEFGAQIKKGNFIFEDEITKFASNVLEEIKKGNPELKDTKFKILISKSHSLNAFCITDGTFVLNLGLFYWLDNEDQFAGVLSHEIAHKVLEHSLKKKERDFLEEKNTKRRISELKKEKYSVSDKALTLFRERLYDKGNRAKQQELQADSLGYVLYRKTNYSKSEYLSAMKLMQRYDSIKPAGLSETVYKKYFDLATQPFNEKWLQKEDFSSYDYSKFTEKIDTDSIASHPETETRIARILSLFPEVKSETKAYNPNPELYKKLAKIAYLETVPNLYFNEDYGLSIYAALLYLERDKVNTAFFSEWLGKSFTKIYEARKNYTLNRYLDRVSPQEQSESYQLFLSFMWNLNLDEIKKIADFYSSENH